MFTILACADDRAVANNKGRIGAKNGPESFNHFFQKINSSLNFKNAVSEMQSIPLASEISETHNQVAHAIQQAHENQSISIFIGGGHDLAFPHLKGVKDSFSGELACINIDPHFDLRPPNPEILSGSPFYLAIEEGIIQGENLSEFGIGEHCNSAELWAYAQKHKINIYPFPKLRRKDKSLEFKAALDKLALNADKIVISLDLDAIQAAFAPGVSAPAAEGFFPEDVLEMMRISAQEPKVCSLGIYELNPLFDIDNRTARLAALLAFEFIRNRMN